MPRLYGIQLSIMADKFQNKYRIPSARAVWHDYNGGDYFITICTSGREHYFGEIVNGEMILNVLGMKLKELIEEIPSHHPYAQIPVYLVMPNHVHGIIVITESCRGEASVPLHVHEERPGSDASPLRLPSI